jgi:methyl-accepting chemotaxis protein
MNLFSRFKTSSGTDDEIIDHMIAACRRHMVGEADVSLDSGMTDGRLAELADILNDVFSGGASRVDDADGRIRDTLEHVRKVRNGDFESRLIRIQGDDVVADLMHAVNDLTDIVDAFVRESGASLEAVSRNVYYRKIFTTGLHGGFLHTANNINSAATGMGRKVDEFAKLTNKLVNNIRNVASAVSSIDNTISSVSQIADDTSERSTTVATAAEETSSSVQAVAASAEEMQMSVSEISRQMDQAAGVAATAIQQMEESNRVMQGLSRAASNIGEIVNLINDIASQTNLLALNATIEAARAGDAGKGFAVVASEVKSLATQTAKATEDISRQVMDMQSATSEAVGSMGTVGATIGEINNICSTVASAITQQEAATKEISRSMAVAASGTQTVSDNIKSVQEGASNNSQAVEELRTTTTQLAADSQKLVDEATDFLTRSA